MQECSYTPEVGAQICDGLASGKSLLAVSRELGLKYATIRKWEEIVPEHGQNSMRARAIGCHVMADQCIDIADDARNDWMQANHQDDAGWKANGEHVQRSRLRIDTRMRLLGKWLPKVYGEKVEQTIQGPNGGPVEVASVTLVPMTSRNG